MRDGAALRLVDVGEGLPVLFQHGLGGDARQAAEAFPARPGLRRLTLECRRHGGSGDGPTRPYSLALFAEDLLAALEDAFTIEVGASYEAPPLVIDRVGG